MKYNKYKHTLMKTGSEATSTQKKEQKKKNEPNKIAWVGGPPLLSKLECWLFSRTRVSQTSEATLRGVGLW